MDVEEAKVAEDTKQEAFCTLHSKNAEQCAHYAYARRCDMKSNSGFAVTKCDYLRIAVFDKSLISDKE